MKLYVTADLHFGHANIIRYCNRPWLQPGDLDENGNWTSPEIAIIRVQEMNRVLINKFNSTIKSDDLVINIGDFCFKNSKGGKTGEGVSNKAYEYIKQLNGIWTFVKGNHCGNNSLKTHISNLTLMYGNHKFFVVHNPEHANPHIEINLVGHVHNNWKIRPLGEKSVMYNVGVDVQDFMPITIEKVLADLNQWRRNGKK